MNNREGAVICDGCGVEITWSPVVRRARSNPTKFRASVYCCIDCAEGRPCRCGERMEFDDDLRERGKISLPI